MNKTYIFKRNRSQDVWRPVQQTPTSRRRSLTRERDAASRAGGVYKSEFPLHESLTRTSNSIGTGGSPSMRRLSSQSPSAHQGKTRHRDLKRKFIFKLHDEIEKPIHTTVLEEISDLDRITSICLSTLHQMMENKHQRKFLHHMNNVSNNSNNNNHQSLLNLSNNSSQPPPAPTRTPPRKKSTPRQSFSVMDSDKVSSTVERVIKDSQEARKSLNKMKPHDLKLVRVQKNKDIEDPRKNRGGSPNEKGSSPKSPKQVSPYKESTSQSRRGSTGSKVVSYRKDTESRRASFLREIDQMEIEIGADTDLKTQKALKTMTPFEALHCKWIRLTKDQIATLEQLCREQGIDPGIHAHSDVSDPSRIVFPKRSPAPSAQAPGKSSS